MDLVIDEVVQFHHIYVAHRHRPIEGLSGAAVDQRHLPRGGKARPLEHCHDIFLPGSVEDRAGDRYTMRKIHCKVEKVFWRKLVDFAPFLPLIDLAEEAPKFAVEAAALDAVDYRADAPAQPGCGPPEMGLKDLADVHAARHAERVQHDIDRDAVLEVRHVLARHDPRDYALVAVAARHLIAGLELAFDRYENLDHLHHAGRELVTALQLFDLTLETSGEARDGILHLVFQGLDILHLGVVADRDLFPVRHGVLGEDGLGNFDPRRHTSGPANCDLAEHQLLQPSGKAALKDPAFVVAVLGKPFDLSALDCQRTFVLIDAAPGEDAHFDDCSGNSRRQPQRSVAHVRSLFAENRTQQLFLGRHRRLALGSDLPDEDIARLHLGADINDARLVEVLQCLFADIRNIAGDLLLTELGVARHDLELFDMDRGKYVVGDDPLGDQERILKVIPVPRHECAQHIPTEGKLAQSCRGAIRDDVARHHVLTDFDEWLLGDASVLVRALELQEIVNVDARGSARGLFSRADDDAGSVDLIDDARPTSDNCHPGITGDSPPIPVPTSGASARISGTA